MSSSKIRILIVEDHPLYRVGLRMVLPFTGLDCVVMAETENVAQTLDYLQRYSYEIDLIMLDYYLPDGTGMEILKTAKQRNPDIKVLLVTSEENPSELQPMIAAGLNGYVSKDVNPQGLATVLTSVFQGKDYFCNDPKGINAEMPLPAESGTFTKRELDIIRLCSSGKTSREIAEALCISPRTVEAHKDNIFNKIGCNSTAEMVNYAFVIGLL